MVFRWPLPQIACELELQACKYLQCCNSTSRSGEAYSELFKFKGGDLIFFFFLIFNCLGFFGVGVGGVGVVMFRESANTWIKWSSDCGVAFLMQSIMHTNSKTYPTLWLSLYFWRSWSNKKLPFSSLFVRPDVTVTQRISLELQRSNPVITAMFLQ